MKNDDLNILKYQIKEILNRYPKSLKINVDKNELSVSLVYDYYEAWNKFLNTNYKWDIINVDLDKDFNTKYLKMLLKAKQFLKTNYRRK